MIAESILAYNNVQQPEDKRIGEQLAEIICKYLPESENKVWHGHPVWFLNGNPVVGYSRQKRGMRLMFWSGAGFEEEGLNVKGKKFKDASVFYNSIKEINGELVKRWLEKSRKIQWDYKNLIKRKGVLERLV